jgi:hypothetical protein
LYQNQVQNKPTAAYWLSLIGGILGLLASLGVLAVSLLVGALTLGFGFLFTAPLGIWMLISSIIVMVAAGRLKANPIEHTKWGAIILIFSIIGVLGVIGALLAFIGGILAIVYKPVSVGAAPQYAPQPSYTPPPQPVSYAPPPPQQQYQQPTAHVCPQCGTMVAPNVRFCPNCGKQQY